MNSLSAPTSRNSSHRPWIVGVIGGIASGKSEVTNYLKSKGAEVISADAFGHQVLEYPEVIDALRSLFGDDVLDESRTKIERSKIAAMVFGNSDQAIRNRKALEKIVHPRIRELTRKRLAELTQQRSCPMIVLDVPLLLEAGWRPDCDRVLFVDCPIEIRQARAIQRGWTVQQFLDRESAQMLIEEKRRNADDIVDNTRSISELHRSLDRWWESLTSS